MDIRKFQLFVDIAETENFTKTGERMGYTQSGVSHLLKSLETELGFSLFIRSKQGVKLTNDAKLLLPAVHSLLANAELLRQNIDEINGLETGHLTIATYSSISIHLLPKIIYAFLEKHPGISIKLMEGGTDDIVNWVSDNRADFGFLSRRHTECLEWIPLCEDPLVAVVPTDYPVPEGDIFPIQNFENQNFVISDRGTDYDIHHALDASHITPCINFTSMDDHAIISLVANKLGISILPKLILRNFESQVSTYPLSPFYSRELGIGLKAKELLSPAARKFIKLTTEMMPGLM